MGPEGWQYYCMPQVCEGGERSRRVFRQLQMVLLAVELCSSGMWLLGCCTLSSIVYQVLVRIGTLDISELQSAGQVQTPPLAH
jgi:hypothetical protein